MSSPQNIGAGTCVSLNRFVYGMDFNQKYIIVLQGQPPEDDAIYDIQIFSLNTIQVVRTITAVRSTAAAGKYCEIRSFLDRRKKR